MVDASGKPFQKGINAVNSQDTEAAVSDDVGTAASITKDETTIYHLNW